MTDESEWFVRVAKHSVSDISHPHMIVFIYLYFTVSFWI